MTSGCYILREGRTLLSIYSTSRPITEVLRSDAIDQDERRLLETAMDVRRFAMEHIGLTTNDNYTTYIRTERKYLADIVSACDELRFNQYRWNYPVVGSMPYKGFFHRTDAIAEADRLRGEGFDVYHRTVRAFSTLGWFSDPLFSFMKDYSEYQIANLLIHEQTHATIFRKGQGDFNENLATFVGDQGALEYLRYRHGNDSALLAQVRDETADRAVFARKLQELYDALNTAYGDGTLGPEDKRQRKAAIISQFKDDWEATYAREFRTDRYRWIARAEINNAFIMTFRNYVSDQDEFKKRYEESGRNLRKMIESLK